MHSSKTKNVDIGGGKKKPTHWEEWSWPSLGFWHGPSGETQGLDVESECCYSSAFSCHFGQSNIR